VRAAGETFSDIYFLRGFRVQRLRDGEPWSIITTSHHSQYFPNVVSRLDASGKVVSEYWHSGNLWRMEVLDLDRDGTKEIILAGVSNGRHSATVVILDPFKMRGASQEDTAGFQLLDMGVAREKQRVWLPRSCMNRQFRPFPYVTGLVASGEEIRVDTTEWTEGDSVASVSFHLDPAARLRQAAPSSYFVVIHERLRREGRLDHGWSEAEAAELSGLKKP
jgi:hypothetical protein